MKKTGLLILLAAMTLMISGCGDENITINNSKPEETTIGTETSETVSSSEIVTKASSEKDASETKENKTEADTTTKESVKDASESKTSGQNEVTYEMEQTAINQIDCLNTILAMFGGRGTEYDESDTVTDEIDSVKINYSKVKDSIKSLNSIEDLKNYMKGVFTDEEYNKMMQDFEYHFKDSNGSLYMNTDTGRSYYQFSCDSDQMVFADVTDHSFTVKGTQPDAMFGYGYVYFEKYDDHWKISGYEYK